MNTMLPSYLPEAELNAFIRYALAEDVGTGDVTTRATVASETLAEAVFLAKEPGVLAGCQVAERVLKAVDPTLRIAWTRQDGEAVEAGMVFGTVYGSAHAILTAERLALNLLQRMSGIATLTRQMTEAIHPHPARLLDTRKTAPGLRLLDKWAVKLGGGENHRIGLYDQILIKDNHIAAAGGIEKAIQATHHYCQHHRLDLPIEIEARTLDEVQQVLDTGGVDIVLLDNMVRFLSDGSIDTSILQEAVRRVGGRFKTEASGNVTLQTVHAIAATGVDFISCGALTHSVKALDLSLKITLQVD